MAYHIGYKNLFTTTGVTVTVSTEESGYEAANAYDGFGYDWWKPTATGDSWIKVTFASVQAADYVAIWGHNLSDHSSSYKVQYSDDDAAWFDAFTAVSPSNNNTIYKTFTSSSHKYWRLLVNSATTLPAIAGIQIGEYLEMPRNAEIGFGVANLAPTVKNKTAQSETGAFIGGSRLSLGIKSRMKFSNLDPSWVRTNLEPFIEHAQTPAVFVVSWDTVTFTDEIILAWVHREIDPPKYSSRLYMEFGMRMEGTL